MKNNYASDKTKYDFVVLEGGVNDAWDKIAVGEVSPGTAEETDINALDRSTMAGGMEHLLYNAKKLYPEATIIFVFNFKLRAGAPGNCGKMDDYIAEQKKICDKWGVPYVDLYSMDELTTALHPESKGTYSNVYLSDFIHPTSAGYDIIYPYIEEFMIDMVTPDVEPEPDPTVTEPIETPVETPVTDKTDDKKEGGCKSFTVSLGATVAVVSLAAVTVLSKKRR
jgi:lysophospholipase L1-like esterase